MTLLNPWFLAGALAVGLPLWLHLLQKQNPVRLPFSSLMLFEKRSQSTFLERRLRYLLLLALRLALLILAALAFAKPVWELPATTAIGDIPALHLIALDASMSMNHAGRAERAAAEARAVIDALPDRDQAQVLVLGGSVDVVTQRTRDKAELRRAIEAYRPGPLRNSYADVVEAARSLAPEGDLPVRLHLISDFQNSAMPGSFSDLVLPSFARLEVRNVAEADDENWAIESVKGTLRLFGADNPRLDVTVAGFSTEAESRTVTLKINGETVGSRSQEVPAMGRATFSFEGFDAPPGFSRAEATLAPGDDLPADDSRLAALDNSEPEPILFLSSDRRGRDAVYFRAALEASAGARFQMRASSAGEAERLPLTSFALIVLSDTPRLGASPAAKLSAYVEAGGAVWIVVGPETAAAGTLPLTGHRVAPSKLGDRGEFEIAGRVEPTHPALSGVEGLRTIKFFRRARIAADEADEVPAEMSDGTPLMLERTMGAGRVLIFGSSFDNVWNDLPVRPVFVPLVVETARYLVGLAEESRQAIVGSTYELRRGREAGAMVQVFDPSGERALSLGESVSRRDVLLDQVGFYELRAPNATELVAVNPDPRESNPRGIDSDALEIWAGSGGAASGGEAAAMAGEPIKPPPIRIWRLLLLLLVAIALIESVVGIRHLNVKREV